MSSLRAAACALLLASCSADPDAPSDAGGTDAAVTLPPWPSTLPSSEGLGARRGFTIARAIVHVHSPLSHDACDGAGWAEGALTDRACLDHFRAAACALHIDAMMVTDHAPHMNEVPFESGLFIEGDDEPIRDAEGRAIASRMACPDGHRVLMTVGSENELMPLGLERHPGDPSDPAALEALYDGATPASIAAFRAAGALVWQAHTEGQPLDVLRTRALDGLELYNLHANVDPGIRERHLGLPATSFVPALLDFTRSPLGLPPDLAVLSFLEPNRAALERWDTLLAEGLRLSGSGGCDAHENVFTMMLTDGERADSYRRMMFWIQNHLLLAGEGPDAVRDALDAGRFYVTSEVFGSPSGFDFVADDGTTVEMGGTVTAGATLRVIRPSLPPGWPAEPPPTITIHLLRAAAGGAVEVASGQDDVLVHVAVEPGAYRVEVRMVPEHARRYLGSRADRLIREVVWVYSNPIYVAPSSP